ncbi:MAG: hypothetical protein ACLGH4_00080 [Actinomycetes bacterium]
MARIGRPRRITRVAPAPDPERTAPASEPAPDARPAEPTREEPAPAGTTRTG